MPRKSKSTKARSRSIARRQKATEKTKSQAIGATSSKQQIPTEAKTSNLPKSTVTTPPVETRKPESKRLPKIPPTLEPETKKPPTNEEIRETLKQITIENLSIFIKAAVQVMRSYKLPDEFIQRILREAVIVMNIATEPKKKEGKES